MQKSDVFLIFSELVVAQMQHSDSQHGRIISTSQSSPEKELVVIYNRVPKTGSTSFVGVAYDLCRSNGFHVLHVNVSANMHVLTLPNQASIQELNMGKQKTFGSCSGVVD